MKEKTCAYCKNAGEFLLLARQGAKEEWTFARSLCAKHKARGIQEMSRKIAPPIIWELKKEVDNAPAS